MKAVFEKVGFPALSRDMIQGLNELSSLVQEGK